MEDDNDDNLDGLDENKKVGVDIANEMFEQVNKKMKKLQCRDQRLRKDR